MPAATPKLVTNAEFAMAALPEEQRLAIAINVLNLATSPHSVQQLRRASDTATRSADAITRKKAIRDANRKSSSRRVVA